jgi:ferredoxin
MSARKIISIDQETCTGCGLCIPNCPEGALRIIDGKARLVSDLFCDGLGACLGYCPEGAITVEEREAEPYDERKVMANIAAQGANTIRAHLEHLESHGESALHAQAVEFLREKGIPIPGPADAAGSPRPGCGTSDAAADHRGSEEVPAATAPAASELDNWPIQLHLLSPMAPALAGRHVLLAADCVAYASGSFHASHLKGKALAIACPKLDEDQEVYTEKIAALIDHARISSLTVMMMQVPCCRGLLARVQEARQRAHRRVPVEALIVGIEDGAILSRQEV